MTHIRHAAVAGAFYPGNPRDLDTMVRRFLADAETTVPEGPIPKAIIAPHAGYVYSGAVAAAAYARLKPAAGMVRRVVLLGPCHRVAVTGLAVSSADAFETPLGAVPLDKQAIESILSLPQVPCSTPPTRTEHSLEVHLPFLQEIFDDFALVPLVVGRASGDEVADVLERLWGGPETVIVISSDLSHYLDYETAREIDAATCKAIETLDASAIGGAQACGRVPVAGLLTLARRRGLRGHDARPQKLGRHRRRSQSGGGLRRLDVHRRARMPAAKPDAENRRRIGDPRGTNARAAGHAWRDPAAGGRGLHRAWPRFRASAGRRHGRLPGSAPRRGRHRSSRSSATIACAAASVRRAPIVR